MTDWIPNYRDRDYRVKAEDEIGQPVTLRLLVRHRVNRDNSTDLSEGKVLECGVERD